MTKGTDTELNRHNTDVAKKIVRRAASPFRKRALGDIAHIQPGLRTRPFTGKNPGRPVKVIGALALSGTGEIDGERLTAAESFGQADGKYRVRSGDLLLPVANPAATLGRCCLVPAASPFEGVVFRADVIAIRLPESGAGGLLDPRLLQLWFQWLAASGQAAAAGLFPAGAPAAHRLSRTALAELPVPVPPPARQKKLTALLDASDGAFAAALAAAEQRRLFARQAVVGQMMAGT